MFLKSQRNMSRELNIHIFLILFTFYRTMSTYNAVPIRGEKVEAAEPNDFPFVVSLDDLVPFAKNERYLNHFCGGSLITKRHVLTAAHCIANKKLANVTVTAGSRDLNEGKLYAIESWITYDEWAKNNNILPKFSSNDIAVITLSEDVTDVVAVVRSNLPEAKVFGKKVVTVGWGRLSNNLKPRFLRKAYLRVLTLKECKRNVVKLFGSEDHMPENSYCTAAKTPIVLGCGDSGGPLLLKDTKEIVGINEAACSVENSHIHPYATSIHVKVNFYKEFIDVASKGSK